MKIQLDWPDSAPNPSWVFLAFLQHLLNRWVQGYFRYGMAHKRKKYLTKARMELREYSKTGNIESLVNTGVYLALELEAPQNKKQHFNAYAPSVTRGKV